MLDLLNISDPGGLGGQGTVFTFPFQTTEAVWPEDATTLVLANDNNHPATGGRKNGVRDGTEFIRVRLAAPLRQPRDSAPGGRGLLAQERVPSLDVHVDRSQ